MNPCDDELDYEFAQTGHNACRDDGPGLLWCRRFPNHKGDHAAGYGSARRRW